MAAGGVRWFQQQQRVWFAFRLLLNKSQSYNAQGFAAGADAMFGLCRARVWAGPAHAARQAPDLPCGLSSELVEMLQVRCLLDDNRLISTIILPARQPTATSPSSSTRRCSSCRAPTPHPLPSPGRSAPSTQRLPTRATSPIATTTSCTPPWSASASVAGARRRSFPRPWPTRRRRVGVT